METIEQTEYVKILQTDKRKLEKFEKALERYRDCAETVLRAYTEFLRATNSTDKPTPETVIKSTQRAENLVYEWKRREYPHLKASTIVDPEEYTTYLEAQKGFGYALQLDGGKRMEGSVSDFYQYCMNLIKFEGETVLIRKAEKEFFCQRFHKMARTRTEKKVAEQMEKLLMIFSRLIDGTNFPAIDGLDKYIIRNQRDNTVSIDWNKVSGEFNRL